MFDLLDHGISMAGEFLVMADMYIRLRGYGLDFGDRHQGKEPNEKEEEHRENSERAKEGENVDDRRREVTPARRQEITRERGADDHEALEPHADVHENCQDPHQGGVVAHPLRPEELWRDD